MVNISARKNVGPRSRPLEPGAR